MTTPSIQSQARAAGVLYLFIIVAGIFAEAFVRSSLIAYDDAATTARNILANETLFRLGFSAEILMLAFDTTVAVLLYRILKPAGKDVSLLAAALRLVSIAVSAAKALLHLTPLVLLGDADALRGMGPEQLQALSLAALKLHGQGYNISLVFFGFHCLAAGYLIARSTYLPRLIGWLMGLAGLCYLTSSFANFLAPSLAGQMFPWILLPCLIAEGALALWLVVGGVNVPKWQARAAD